ncbi:cytochrome P450 714C2 [Cannabis sativa]|uniref:Cytochrome P450 n=1 Tax=Cannabis sativa TaxID=3483 RepID=A0A803NIK0_CANSA|nr:cytochrome P450 714C2 [Cannabis sativa]
MEMLNVVIGVLVGGFVLLFLYLYNSFVLEPIRLRSKLQKQGIGGPLPSFLLGNISEMKKIKLELSSKRTTTTCNTNDKLYDVVSIGHHWPSTIFPHLIQWRVDHGPIFSYAVGNIQFLCITDIELVKEVSLCTSLSLGKPSYLSKNHGPLFGQGIISSSGQIWAHQKKIIAPELYIDKVKGMVELMVNSTNSLIRSWEKKIEDEGGVSDIKVDDDLRSLSADIISKACFGSSYSQGEQIFSKLRTLQKLMSKRTIGIPGIRFIPTMNNIHVWRLEKQINAMILEVVKQRTEAADEKDLLQMIVEGAKACGGIDSPSVGLTHDKFIVDNCKSIYFAGHETTATTASWALLLLAAYPAWQTRVRAEVEEVWKNGSPHANMLRSMKVLTMVIQETLRLYPPGVYVVRNALQDVQFKDILVPKGINIQIPISMMQQDTNLWGPDAQQFNPGRFEHGILGASKFPQAYMPFGIGTRICIGQHMAMTELKVVLSLILSKFCFSVSPAYRHSAAFRLVIESEHGVNLQVRRI